MKPLAFFYPANLALGQLVQLVQGIVAGEDLNLVDFPEEKGGRADQQLAVPFLAGMDTIEVEEARLSLRAVARELEIEDFKVTDNGGSGIFLSLPTPARLKKVELSYQIPSAVDAAKVRLVVRAATPSGGGFQAGVPLFSAPDFGKPGEMFEAVLGGMSLSSYSGGRRVITLPSMLGSAWLIQLATGDEATKLQALPVRPTVSRVVLDATPRNLSVTLMTGEEEVLLWNNPESLFPAAGEQLVSFTPLAQRHLAAALAKAGETAVTLPVPLRFSCESGGTIQITATSLKSEYLVRPLGETPAIFDLRGNLTPLVLSAPAALPPKSSTLRLTARLLGRELNMASPDPPVDPPVAGLRIGLERIVAAAAAVAPLAGQAAGSLLELASARVYLTAREAFELVLEVRSDVAGSPGPVAASSVVRKLEDGFSGWLEFELAKPLVVVSGQAPLWLALRSNKGEVFWFAAGAGTGKSRISTDRGESWGTPEPALAPAGDLLVQLFHFLKDPMPAPVIRLQNGAAVVAENLFAGAKETAAREYRLSDSALPAPVHALLAGRAGGGRVESRFLLFSRSVLDLTIENLTLRYDPFQGTGGSGGSGNQAGAVNEEM